jgi:tetratricopeptide (TPR) repeat protein
MKRIFFIGNTGAYFINEMLSRKLLFPYAAILLVAVTVYAKTAEYGFVFDDFPGILNAHILTSAASVPQALRLLGEPWRGVTQLSYALTINMAGTNPLAFHITNILIHALNALLVFGIAQHVAGFWMATTNRELFALAAGSIHAVHPLYSEGVAYVWGRSSSLCASFYFGAVLLVMAGYRSEEPKKYLWYSLSLVSGVLAWKTKEEAITLPFVIAGFFALVGCWRAAGLLTLLSLGLIASRWSDIVRLTVNVRESQSAVLAGAAPVLDRLSYSLTYVKASVLYYLRMFVLPLNQNVNPEIERVTTIVDPLFLVSVTVLILLVVWSVASARRSRVVSFGLIALLVSPLLSYLFMPLADVVAEHRIYIAGLGFDLLLASLITRFSRHSLPILSALVIVLGLMTVQRNQVWANSLTLWKDAEQKSPKSARPHLNLGLAYQSAGTSDAAVTEYSHALSINPKLTAAYVNLAGIYFARNDLNSAESVLNRAAALSPSLPQTYIDLAVIALRRNRAEEALELLDKAEALDDSYLVHLYRGDALAQLDRAEDAAREYD